MCSNRKKNDLNKDSKTNKIINETAMVKVKAVLRRHLAGKVAGISASHLVKLAVLYRQQDALSRTQNNDLSHMPC